MSCTKYTLTNTGTTSVNFNYRRCDDTMWEYQVQLDPNQTKNIWAIDGTYTIADYFKPEIGAITESVFPPQGLNVTPTPTATVPVTPTNTPTNSSTPTVTPTNTSSPTVTPTNSQTPTPTEPIRYEQANICHDETDEQFVCDCPQFASIWTDGPDMASSTIAFSDPTGPNTGNAEGFYAQDGVVYEVSTGCGPGCTTGSTITVFGSCGATPTPTATVTQTPTPSIGSSPTPTSSLTATPTETPTNTQTPTNTETPTNTPTPTNTETPTNTPTNTNTQTPTNTETPTLTPTQTPFSSTGYSFNLIGTYTIVNPGQCILQTGNPTNSATTNPNLIGYYLSGATDLIWDDIDEYGRDSLGYYGQFTGQTIFATISQTGSTAIYSGNTTSLRYSGGRFQFGYHPATTAFTEGDVVLLQEASTTWVTGLSVDISFSLTNPIPETTPTPTTTSTETPTPTNTPTNTETSTPTVTPTNTETPTTTPTATVTETPTNTPTATVTETPTQTPTPSTTPIPVTGYSFNLVVLPYTFPSSGNTIMVDQAFPSTGTTNPNLMAIQGNGIYFNAFDSNGIDRTSYFSSFTGQSITITMSQTGSTAIYSGSSTAFQSWTNSGERGFNFNYGVAQSGYSSGTTVLIQSATTNWVTGQTVTISAVVNETGVTPTPTATSVTPTPTPTSGYTSGGWLFYTPEGAIQGPPSSSGNTIFVGSDGFATFNPNYTGGTFNIYFNQDNTAGTSYLTQFQGLDASGGTLTISQGSNTAIYSGSPAQYNLPGNFLGLAVNSSAQMIQSASTPFVSGTTINVVVG